MHQADWGSTIKLLYKRYWMYEHTRTQNLSDAQSAVTHQCNDAPVLCISTVALLRAGPPWGAAETTMRLHCSVLLAPHHMINLFRHAAVLKGSSPQSLLS